MGVRVGDPHVTAAEQLKNSRKHTWPLADKKQETAQQGPAQHHRLLDIASSPGVLPAPPWHPKLLRPQGAEKEWDGGCCAAEGLGHRWAVCWARHGAPHSQAVLFQQHCGHIIPVRWACAGSSTGLEKGWSNSLKVLLINGCPTSQHVLNTPLMALAVTGTWQTLCRYTCSKCVCELPGTCWVSCAPKPAPTARKMPVLAGE